MNQMRGLGPIESSKYQFGTFTLTRKRRLGLMVQTFGLRFTYEVRGYRQYLHYKLVLTVALWSIVSRDHACQCDHLICGGHEPACEHQLVLLVD